MNDQKGDIKARDYAVNNLDWKIIAGRYLKEFENIISKWRVDNQG